MAGGALARAQKGALAEGRTILFVDESGCYFLPAVVRTFAPRGQTPMLREHLTRDHLALSSGVTLEGRLLTMKLDHPFRGPDVVRFLQQVLWQVSGPVLVIWDGSPIHHNREVAAFLGTAEGKRVQVERLPGYAPDLNPDEGVWCSLKRVELRNVVCTTVAELKHEVRKAFQRIQHKPHILRACFAAAGLV